MDTAALIVAPVPISGGDPAKASVMDFLEAICKTDIRGYSSRRGRSAC
jgi:hypothetical protein